ncbi:FecR family protein [Methylomonas sp. LW13]|uniref:FecR family protein n=1 Tax=Methylomonas defluvii TaxID=3045149 RepID=A0ABU4UC88_9GAMM|nr:MULTISPECIES: FecR family protein [unclassified Methylomonas]MDX8127056.1 FecR family protein [Methylomonas sp. OY6]PKD39296.1 iron dicitrate transport regulator FecR [Methylomonas sp. Kb3]QBC25601.1 FecR family protein [Methylomonas sp. LW13]
MPNIQTSTVLQQQAIEWILRLDSATCTPADRQAFAEWLALGEDRRRIYQQLASRWNKLDRYKGRDFPVRRQALSYRAPHKRTRRLSTLALAASLLLGLGIATFSEYGWYGYPRHYATERGSRQTVHLADGSRLELSGDTELTLRVNRWRRSVELIKGEAFFSVAHNPQQPFEVQAGHGSIVDIGTEFDVRLQNRQVAVAVLEGAVKIVTSGSREISANQVLAYDQRGDFLESQDKPATITAWLRGQLVFENRRLDEVLSELERFHDTRLTLADPSLAKLRVSGTFHIGNLDGALNVIAMTLPVNIQRPSPGQVILAGR